MDGAFIVAVPPGRYTVVEVVKLAGTPPSLKPTIVNVMAGAYTHVGLLFDTGIR